MVEESIRINKTQVDLFNIPIKLKHAKDEIKVIIQSIKDTDSEIEIIIKFFTSESEKSKFLTVSYNKKALTAYESIFIGWAFLILYLKNKKEEDKAKAIQYLTIAIRNGSKSCLPHYLLGSEPLGYVYNPNLISLMYFAVNNYNDDF